MRSILSKNTLFLAIFAAMLFIIAGCGAQSDDGQAGEQPVEETGESTEEQTNEQAGEVTNEENPIVTITMENDEAIVLELYPDVAPNTVANFVSLVEEGFYDGLIFHRVIPGFMIQGGDPEGSGLGGPGYAIAGEFSSNGFENELKHERGVLSMARTMEPDSAGSQFFIMVEDTPDLDGEYAAFGRVIEGMETVDAIAAAKRDAQDKPLEDQRIKTVTVDTKGIDYPEPEKQ